MGQIIFNKGQRVTVPFTLCVCLCVCVRVCVVFCHVYFLPRHQFKGYKFKGAVQHLGKRTHLVSCRELDVRSNLQRAGV